MGPLKNVFQGRKCKRKGSESEDKEPLRETL